ncbi:MAG: site-specific integrase [Bacteroidota bacterium]
MATVGLYLKDEKASKTRIVSLLTDRGGTRIKLSTGISVSPKHWSKKKKIVLSADNECVAKNNHLNDFKRKILAIYLEALSNDIEPDGKYIQDFLDERSSRSGSREFWNVWAYFIESKKNRFKPRSLSKFKTFRQHLESFEHHTKIPWVFRSITKERLEKFQDYCYQELGLNTYTTSKYIGNFKSFLNWAYDSGYNENSTFRSFKAIAQKDSFKLALTNEELNKIRKAQIPSHKNYLNNVRRLFLLSVNTGLRYSDYSRVKKYHLKENQGKPFLEIMQQKTSEEVRIPLVEESLGIIKALISGDLHPISNQKMNQYLKELGELAGIDDDFEVHRQIGVLRSSSTRKKYELLTTHTGRRTFATNLLLKGIPAETVMQFTGHRDYKSFAKYVNVPKTTQFDMVEKALSGS